MEAPTFTRALLLYVNSRLKLLLRHMEAPQNVLIRTLRFPLHYRPNILG